MSKRLYKIIITGALLMAIAAFAAFAGGCVFGGGVQTYKLTYELCDTAEEPAAYAEGESNPATYTATAHAVELASPARDGYIFRGWFTNPDYTGVGFTALPAGTRGDLTLYARWEITRPTGSDGGQVEGEVATWRGFMPYIEEFDAAYAEGGNGRVTVESRAELTAYCEYVQYKYIPYATAPTVTIDYEYENKPFSTEIRSVVDSAYFASYIGLTWSTAAIASSSVRIGIKYPEYVQTEGSLTSDTKNYFTQIAPYEYRREGAPHEFAIDKASSALNCTTSNQLFYAAMIGAKPVPESGSIAERIYGQAREALNTIINDGMQDYEKARAIYDWLIMNVTYDEKVILDKIAIPAAIEYDAFYLEGVFGSGRAVCDGISKAMTLLCRIEGIPCVRVVGADHAWNKLYIGGHWYIADATFGDTGTELKGKHYSFLTHRSFLVAESSNDRYVNAENYTETAYAAPADFEFYKYEFFGTGSNQANLYIESSKEFRELYNWASTLNIYTPYSVDFYVTDAAYVTGAGTYALDGNYCTLFFNL